MPVTNVKQLLTIYCKSLHGPFLTPTENWPARSIHAERVLFFKVSRLHLLALTTPVTINGIHATIPS